MWRVSRRMKLEKELVAQLWRFSWDEIQISNFDKVLRSGSKLTLSLVSTNTQADTCTHTHTHVHIFTNVWVPREDQITAL